MTKTAAASLFSAALLLASGAATMRAQSALDGFDPNANGGIRVVVVQPDGKILIGGDFTTVSPNGGPTVTRNRLARLNADGTLDTAFNPNANSIVAAIAVQADGKILVGGQFFGANSIGGQSRNYIARLDATTGAADSFNPNANNFVFALAVQTDGKILAGGQFSGANSIGGQTRNFVARLDPDTGLADSFNPNANAFVYSLALQTDGKILAGGQFSGANSIGGQARNRLARLDPSTGLADSFDPNSSDPVYAIAVQADGKVLAGGLFSNIGGQPRNYIARLLGTNGAADSFNPNANNTVNAIALQANGRILVGGNFSGANSIGGQTRNFIARLDATSGAADSFDPNANGVVFSLAVQPDGRILVGGIFTALAPNGGAAVTRNRIARFAQETWTFDPTFQRTPLRITSESATGVKVLSSGKVLTYTINGLLMSGANGQRIGPLVRMDPNTGAIDPTWNPDPTLTGRGFLGVAEAADGKIYYATTLVGDLANGSDPGVNRLVRLNTDGSRDTNFNSPVFGFIARFLALQPDGKIIVCFGGTNVDGVPSPGSILHTVRLNTDGSQDTTFQSPNFQFNATDPLANDLGVFGPPVIDSATGKIYFCGFFRFVNGQTRQGIVRCNADGTVDTSFVPTGLPGGVQLVARAMVLQTGGKVVLGGTKLRTAAGGSTRYALLRFNTDGTLDSTFTLYPTTNSSGVALVPNYFGPRHISAVPGGNILTSDIRVLRFLAGGALDSTFIPLDYSSPYFSPNNGSVAAFRFDVDQNTGAAYLENPYPMYARLGGVPVPGNITKLNPDGTIDSQFNSPIVESEDFAPDVQIAANGAVYVSGYHTAFGNAGNATIARLLANGARDASYSLDTLPFADKQAVGFALLPDSSAYVIYSSGAFNGGYQFSNLVRLLPSGALDTSFRPSSALQTAFSINAFDGNDISKSSLGNISAAPMGRAYLFPEGPQATVNANGNLKLTRVNVDGTEDTTVPPLGFPLGEVTRDASGITGGSSGYLHRLAQTPDGGFIVLASVAPFPTTTGAPYNYKLIRFRADGSQDPNFVSPSVTSTAPAALSFPLLFDPVTGITSQPPNGFYVAPGFPVSSAGTLPDGSFLLTGNFRLNGGSTDYSLAKLTPAGAFDTSFNPPVPQNLARPARPAVITKARVSPDGKIWVLGRFDTIGGSPAPGVARLNPGGTLDSSFSLTGVGYYDSFGDLADVVFANSSTAYLVGTFRRPGEPIPFAVTRIVTLPAPSQVVSRKLHGGVPFDVNLALTGNSGVECRSGGATNDYQIVFTFPSAVTFTSAAVTAGTGTVSSTSGNATASATVNLTGVTNAQRITVTLLGVNNGISIGDVSVPMGVLIGDTNGDGIVNSGDALQTRNRSGQATDATNFRSDVNLDGVVNSGDTTVVRSRSGTSLP